MSESADPPVPTSYSALLSSLSDSDYPLLQQAYAQVQESRSAVDYEAVVTLLSDLSAQLALDLTPAEEMYRSSRIDDDPDDYIDTDNITLEQFRNRLRRFCAIRAEAEAREHQAEQLVESGEKTPSEKPLQRDEFEHRSRRSQSKDERSVVSPRLRSPVAEEDSAAKLEAKMVEKQPQLEAALATQDPSVLTKTVVDECGFKATEDQFQQLTLELVEAFPLASEEEPVDRFPTLLRVVWQWAERLKVPLASDEEDPLAKKLRESIADFEAMKDAKVAAGEDVSMLDSVLKTLKQQLGKVSRDSSDMSKHRRQQLFNERCAKTIREVFRFYSNQLRLIGKTPSFDVIQRNSMTWNVSKFVRFCRDFDLLIDKPKKAGVKTLELPTVKTIFIKNSVLQKEMEEAQFTQALDMLAHMYFDQDYDALNGTAVSGKTTEDKREMLYRFLQFDTGNECLKRAKGFGLPFSSKTDNRVPENDLMKNYKYRPYKQQRAMVEEWKQQKLVQQSVNSRPQIKEFTPPKRAPADAIVSYSSQPPEAEPYVPPKYASKARNPYTWKTLGELNPEEVMGKEEDFDLNNLIADDSSDDDEILKRQYPLAASQPVLEVAKPKEVPRKEAPKQKEADGKSSKFSTPVLSGVKPNALIKTESKPNLEQMTKQMIQKTKEMTVSEMRKEKAQLDKVMKVTEVQRERGNKVLGRLRQSSQFA